MSERSRVLQAVPPTSGDLEDVPFSLLHSSVDWPAELPLSPRECEIARLVACDLCNKEIAAVLEISEWTVSTHLRRIFGKLEVHSKAAMVARVLDHVAAVERRRITETSGFVRDHRSRAARR